MLKVSLFGNFSILFNEAPIKEINTPRLQSLLAYLMLHSDTPLSRAHIANLFWPDTTETQARTNLRNLFHNLRHALPNTDTYLDANVQTIKWCSDAKFYLDVNEFKSALKQSDQFLLGRHYPVAQEALNRAINLYKGDLLPSCYDEWIIPIREEFRQAYLFASDRLLKILEEHFDYPAAIHVAQRLLRFDPLQEMTYQCLMRLYASNGDRAAALRTFHTCATILQRELEVEPSIVTRELYEKLMGAETNNYPPKPVVTTLPHTVGRETEWGLILDAWRGVVAKGGPLVVILSGEAGVGKTRILEDMLQWANRQGINTASTRCYAAEGELAFAPVVAWLRAHPIVPLNDIWLAEIRRLLPEILSQRMDLPQPGALTEDWQRLRFFEALSRAILGTAQPILLTIDDLQWCDRDTLEWIHYLMRFDPTARLLVAGSYRPDEIGSLHPLLSFLRAFRLNEQVKEIGLDPLDEKSTQLLANQLAGEDISKETSQWLYQQTEGNPLFVVETMRAGLPIRGNLLRDVDGRIISIIESRPGKLYLPPKVQSVLETRLAQLTPSSRELAGIAATIGREFSFRLLSKISNIDDDTLVHEIDELWQHRIVREHGTDAYDFSHDRLREVAYIKMSSARRQMLHLRIAQTLETLNKTNLDPVCHQVAAHYEHADLPEQAIPYYLRSALMARRVFANEEAISLLQHGLDLVNKSKPGVEKDHLCKVAGQLWEELGDILELRARHEEALHAYQNAQNQDIHRDWLGLGRLHRKVGAVLREQRFYAEALNAYHQAETVLGESPNLEPDKWWTEWIEVQVDKIWAYYWLAQWHEMEKLVNKAHLIVQERGSALTRARFLMASCLMYLRKYRYTVSDEMLADQKESLNSSQEWGDMKARAECQFEVGFLHLWRRELDAAAQNLQAALDLAEIYGAAWIRTISLTYLMVLCRFRDQTDEVKCYSLRVHEAAVATHMPDYVAAAKANQAWLAWRERDLTEAEQRGREALLLWQQSPLIYPFQWQALWPLIGVSLTRGRDDETWAYVQSLLEPKQQLLPERLNILLTTAEQAKMQNQPDMARALLDQAMEIAMEMGYL